MGTARIDVLITVAALLLAALILAKLAGPLLLWLLVQALAS